MAARVIVTGAVYLLGALAEAHAAPPAGVRYWVCSTCQPSVAPPAYEWAARAAGVPASVLFAVAREESGMPLHGRWLPWPWTLNIDGTARRFSSPAAACAVLMKALQSLPAQGIDIGLGQIDIGYYESRVATPCELLDPYRNLLIAGGILRLDHEPGVSWMVAVGRYHRPAGGALAAQYRRAVAAQLTRVLVDAGITDASIREQGEGHLP